MFSSSTVFTRGLHEQAVWQHKRSPFLWILRGRRDNVKLQRSQTRGREVARTRTQRRERDMKRRDAIRKCVSFSLCLYAQARPSVLLFFTACSRDEYSGETFRFTSTWRRIIRNRCLFYETFYLAAQPAFQYFVRLSPASFTTFFLSRFYRSPSSPVIPSRFIAHSFPLEASAFRFDYPLRNDTYCLSQCFRTWAERSFEV